MFTLNNRRYILSAILPLGLILVVSLLCSGCTGILNIVVGGGHVVELDKLEYSVVRRYAIVSSGNIDFEMVLIEVDGKQVVMEVEQSRSPNQAVLYETHWSDEQGDYYATWVKMSTGAFVFVIPKSFTKNARRYAYPPGQYHILEIDGQLRPVSRNIRNKYIEFTPCICNDRNN